MSILTSVLTTAVELFTDEISQQEIAQTTEGLKKAMQKAYSSSPPTIDWHPGLNTRTTDTPAGYLTMTVTRIQLDKGRILWRERYPILNVECKVNAANQQARQYTTVIGGGTQDTAGNWAMADANILMQVPYQGGPVPLTVTLYSHPGKNYMKEVMGSVTELSELVPSLPFQEAGKVLNQTQSIVNAIIKVDGAQVVMGGAKGLIKDNAIETGDHLLYDTNKGANVQIDDRDVLVNGRSVIGEQDHPFVLIRVELHAKPGNLRAPDTETEGNSLEKGINAIIDTMLEDIRRYRKNEYGSKIVRALHEPFLALAEAYQNTAYLLPTDAASAFQQVKDGLFRGLLVSVNPTDRQYLQDFFDLSQLTQPAATPTTGAPANAARAGANALRGGETTYPGSLETPVALLRAELPTTFDWNIKGQPINPEAIRQRFQELELQASRKKIPAKRASMSS